MEICESISYPYVLCSFTPLGVMFAGVWYTPQKKGLVCLGRYQPVWH